MTRFGIKVEGWQAFAEALKAVGISDLEDVMSEIREHECVVLMADLAGEKLAAGNVGAVVHVYENGMASLTLQGPVAGPLCLGWGCHFRLGSFVPGDTEQMQCSCGHPFSGTPL